MITGIARALLPSQFYRRLRRARGQILTWWETKRIEKQFRERRTHAPRLHDLPGQLFISLTSYPARFKTLHLTLESLLQQDTKPDGVLLWIAHDDMQYLPRKVLSLVHRGLTICACDDVRSYKKLIFALKKHPDATIVTSDDDVYYSPEWLAIMIEGVDRDKPMVICQRAHRYKATAEGKLLPYMHWEQDVQDDAALRPSSDIIPIGVGGVLYPPHCLDERVFDREAFTAISPNADDLWFYWMARRAGTLHKKVGPRFELFQWPGTQESRLFDTNREGGNDQQIAALQAAFGPPGPAGDLP